MRRIIKNLDKKIQKRNFIFNKMLIHLHIMLKHIIQLKLRVSSKDADKTINN